ncbi:MAG: MFS transporter [Nocardioides sp.]
MNDNAGVVSAVTVSSGAGIAMGSRRGAALIAAMVLASMVGLLDASVVNVSIPAIGRSFGAGTAPLQWCVAGYLLTVASLLLVSGALADRFGRRRVLASGLTIMFVASLLCAAAPTVAFLVGARVVQGMGAALVVPSSLALLNGTLARDARARGVGVWAGLATLGTTLVPYAGGWLVDQASWRWVFLLNPPLILGCLWALRFVPETAIVPRARALDIGGALLVSAGLGGAVYALTSGPTHGWSDPAVLIAILVAIAALAGILPVERRQQAPMLRLSLFRSHQFSAINVTTVLFYGALGAAGYLLVPQCELLLSYSAAAAGAVLIPSSAVFLAIAPVSGVLVGRFGPRWLMVIGISTVAGALAVMSTARPGTPLGLVGPPGALLWGLGIGVALAPLTAAVLAAVKDDDLGEAAAVNDAAARLGSLGAIALVPTVIGVTRGSGFDEALVRGFQPAMLGLAATCLVAALVSGLFVSDERRTAPRFGTPHPHACNPPVPSPATTT